MFIIGEGDIRMSNDKILKKITKDVNHLQFQIEHRKLYNTFIAFVRFWVKSGIILDKSFPFFLSTVLVLNSNSFKNDKAFKRDIVSKPAYIQTINTSNGIFEENIRAVGGDNIVEYSSAWMINNTGLYERTVVTYKVNNKINLKNIDEILSMTEEELNDLLKIIDVNVVTKEYLTEEDQLYNEDVVIVTQYIKSKDDKILRQETGKENFRHSSLYVFSVWLYAIWIMKIKKFFIKNVVEDTLEEYLTIYKYIRDDELKDLRKILEIKCNNLDMLQDKTQDKGKSLSRVRKR